MLRLADLLELPSHLHTGSLELHQLLQISVWLDVQLWEEPLGTFRAAEMFLSSLHLNGISSPSSGVSLGRPDGFQPDSVALETS